MVFTGGVSVRVMAGSEDASGRDWKYMGSKVVVGMKSLTRIFRMGCMRHNVLI